MTLYHRAADIALDLKTRLEAVTVALGAETDLGLVVYQGRRHIDRDQIPCCVIIEGDDVPERIKARNDYQLTQRYVLMAFVPCDPDNPNVAAHKAIRDMKRAVFLTGGVSDWRLGETVKDVQYLGRDIGPRADGERFVLAIVEIGVGYVENVSDP